MAAVAGGVNQHIGRGRRDRPIQDGLQRFVAGLAVFKAQVVTEDHEFFGAIGHHVDDVWQVDQVGFVHLNQTQALIGIGIQASLDQR